MYSEYYDSFCDPVSSDVITYSYAYNVLRSTGNDYTLYTKSIEVDLSDNLYDRFNCSQSTPSKSVDQWFCYKSGKDLFANEKSKLGQTTTATLSFGGTFAIFNGVKFPLVMGGDESGFCNEEDISQSMILVVIAIVVIVFFLCCCICCCRNMCSKSSPVCFAPKTANWLGHPFLKQPQ